MDNQNTVKEFVSGDSITLNMQLTPKEYSMMREWSLSIPTLYMLDICVVSATKLTSALLGVTTVNGNYCTAGIKK